eukprot:3984851-Pleurochrysis_carterae.AAC.3
MRAARRVHAMVLTTRWPLTYALDRTHSSLKASKLTSGCTYFHPAAQNAVKQGVTPKQISIAKLLQLFYAIKTLNQSASRGMCETVATHESSIQYASDLCESYKIAYKTVARLHCLAAKV